MQVTSWITRFSRGLNLFAGLLSILLVLLTVEQVISRYFFSASSIAMQELQWHVFAAIFLLASAYSIHQDDHVRVDIFYARFTPRQRLWVDTGGFVLFLVPSMILLAYFGYDFMMQARSYSGSGAGQDTIWAWFLQGEASPNPGGLAARWLLKALIPVFAVLNIVQGLASLTQRWSKRNDT